MDQLDFPLNLNLSRWRYLKCNLLAIISGTIVLNLKMFGVLFLEFSKTVLLKQREYTSRDAGTFMYVL